jgi:hypothetical protein
VANRIEEDALLRLARHDRRPGLAAARIAARESSPQSGRLDAVWQVKHCCAITGRIFDSKNSVRTDSGFAPLRVVAGTTRPFLIHSTMSLICASLSLPPIGIFSVPLCLMAGHEQALVRLAGDGRRSRLAALEDGVARIEAKPAARGFASDRSGSFPR